MSKFQVNHSYRGLLDDHTYVVLEAGSEVDLDDARAEWIERDSPGVLSKPRPVKQAKAGQDRSA